jgi:hypothetical protein
LVFKIRRKGKENEMKEGRREKEGKEGKGREVV